MPDFEDGFMKPLAVGMFGYYNDIQNRLKDILSERGIQVRDKVCRISNVTAGIL